jgi:hypothetical protein
MKRAGTSSTGLHRDTDHGGESEAAARASRALWVFIGGVLPIVVYFGLREVLHSDGYALAVSALIPLTTVLARTGTRRFGLIAAIATVVLVVALTVSIASGGSALPLKLRRAAITGPLGMRASARWSFGARFCRLCWGSCRPVVRPLHESSRGARGSPGSGHMC